ncbi:MAG: 3-isopropylmalate dehydratase large subunit, partial [Clostridiales bacterium]|nr:3-isopropylmalate dehydratase large subunit [Clostridiales bacterium]
TCTYGAVGAFSTGVGSTDLACAMARGKTWFKVPEAIKVVLTGRPGNNVTGKDIILHLIGMIGVDGALYKSLEFAGDGIANLSIYDRLTICNMAIECGAKNGIFPVDDITTDYISKADPDKFSRGDYEVFAADEDACYSDVIEIDLSSVPLTVALPHLPSNTRRADEIKDMKIDQVLIGSCTNGRIGDIRKAAEILRGRKIHPDVRCIIIPGSQKVYRTALDEGLLEIFDNAGCVISTPTCGPCLGGHMGVLAKGERCVSTTNRNFVGRMGDVDSEVILSGVPVACASAVLGRVATPDEL